MIKSFVPFAIDIPREAILVQSISYYFVFVKHLTKNHCGVRLSHSAMIGYSDLPPSKPQRKPFGSAEHTSPAITRSR